MAMLHTPYFPASIAFQKRTHRTKTICVQIFN